MQEATDHHSSSSKHGRRQGPRQPTVVHQRATPVGPLLKPTIKPNFRTSDKNRGPTGLLLKPSNLREPSNLSLALESRLQSVSCLRLVPLISPARLLPLPRAPPGFPIPHAQPAPRRISHACLPSLCGLRLPVPSLSRFQCPFPPMMRQVPSLSRRGA